MARADEGFAELFVDDLPQNGQIVLRPWGKIQGTLTIGGKPKANEILYLSRWPKLDDKTLFTVVHDQTVRTDADGKFVVSQIAPGDIWLTRRLRPITASITHFAHVNIKPAETAQVTLGGGRTVIGHLTEPKEFPETILWQGNGNWTEGTIRLLPEHPFKRPADWYNLTAAQQHARMEEWGKTAEGQASKASLFSISFLVEPDGTLTIPDLTPGQYEMKIQTSQGPDLVEPIASLDRTLEIEKPASPGGSLDLGGLEVKLHPRLRIGDLAPNFECQTLAGTPLKLSCTLGENMSCSTSAKTAWSKRCIMRMP